MTTKTSTPALYEASSIYTLRSVTCYLCGVLFGLEDSYATRRRNDHREFSCPNGHSQAYIGKSKVEQERDAARELAQRESRRRELAERQAGWANDDAERARRSAAAYKGWATRIRNRIANGVCPCCNRSFTNVRRHMTTKHPDYTIPEVSEA